MLTMVEEFGDRTDNMCETNLENTNKTVIPQRGSALEKAFTEYKKAAPPKGRRCFQLKMSDGLTVDSRSGQRNGSCLTSSQVKREVVSITLVHHFHTQVGTVDYVSPGAHHTTL